MASLAGDLEMFSLEGIFRVGMLEGRSGRPYGCAMAGGAVGIETASMRIIMAYGASRRQTKIGIMRKVLELLPKQLVLDLLSSVTLFAGNHRVFAGQGESGAGMIQIRFREACSLRADSKMLLVARGALVGR